MALDASQLSDDLEDIFSSLPATATAAADQLAAAYYAYAGGGMFGSSTLTLTTALRDAMAVTLKAALEDTSTGSPAVFAAAWASSVASFWVAVPVVGTQSGATVGCPGAAALTATLTTLFSNLANTAATVAAGLSAALHTATATVTATVAPPPGTVLPIA